MKKEVQDSLLRLVDDLYSEGYACSWQEIDEPMWKLAWAITIYQVATGVVEYDDDLVVEVYDALREPNDEQEDENVGVDS